MRLATILATLVLLTTAPAVLAQNAVRLVGPGAWVDQSTPLVIEVRVDNDAEIDTIRLAIGHDETQVTLDDFTVDIAAAALPSNPFIEIFPADGGAIAQIILDQPLSPATDTLIATLTYNAVSPTSVQDLVAVLLEDGVYGAPPASNEFDLTAGGTIGAGSGLILESYVAGILAFAITETDVPVGGTGTATVLLSTDTPVQGYQVAVAHDPAELTLEDVNLSGTITEALGAEFVVPEVFLTGGTLSVILDLEAPFDGQIIPVGSQQAIGQLEYSCVEHPLGLPPVEYTVDFVDGVLGAFPVYNIVVSEAGETLSPQTIPGTIRCLTELLSTDVQYYAGRLEADTVVPVQGLPGDTVDVGLFYTEPQFALDALDISLSFGCELAFVGGFSIIGSILETVGADFIAFDLDTDSTDGDGCEFTAQIVIDSLPPFDGQQAPASATPLLLSTLSGSIPSDAVVGTSYPLEFIDGLDGATATPVDNQVMISGFSYPAVGNASSVQVEVPAGTPFIRGDCNEDGGIDISDAIAFLDVALGGTGGLFSCDAACDSNDDGALDIADAVYSLSFLFSGGPQPAAPFPNCGASAAESCASFAGCP